MRGGADARPERDPRNAYLARISHELRTPLNIVLGCSESLRAGFAGDLEPLQQRFVEDIAASAQDLLVVVERLLEAAKVAAASTEHAIDARARGCLDTAVDDLCTPLRAVIASARALRDGAAGPLSPKQAEYVSDVFDTGEQLLVRITSARGVLA